MRAYVEGYTAYDMRGYEPGVHAGLPSGHLTFVLPFDAPLVLGVLPDGSVTPRRFDAVVGGFHTRPAAIVHDGNQRGIQLHVTAAGARALFAMPAAELGARVASLDALPGWSRLAGELLDRLQSAATWDARFAILDRVLAGVADRAVAPAPRAETTEAMRRLVATKGTVDIASLAGDVGWSRRHLSARFGAEYGVTPKEMARVLRFQRAKSLLVAGRAPLVAIAAECGYADQAHMNRDWRDLAGASPTRWLAAEALPVAHATEDAGSRSAA